jgi:hypothetical protein
LFGARHLVVVGNDLLAIFQQSQPQVDLHAPEAYGRLSGKASETIAVTVGNL